MNIEQYLKDKFQNKRCRILGFARSNKPLVTMLLDAGATVTVHEKNEDIPNQPDYKAYAERGVEFVLGESYLADGLCADYIFRSPGFRPDLDEMVAAIEQGAILSSEMELFLRYAHAALSESPALTERLRRQLLPTSF